MNEPRYDEDYVNLGYLNKKTLEEYQKTNAEINKRSQNFGSQPNPPYYVNDTYMDGKDIYICINSRIIGDFNALDWELASEYVTDGNMDARLLALNTAIGVVLDDLQEQIDGTVDIWTYEGEPTLLNEPAVNWDTPSELNKHVGDVYNDMLTGDSYRFVYYDDEYLWLRITDSQAAAAYTLAQQAKDTADGKMRVFISTPYTPYNVGDLWAQGSSGGLYRCKTAKLTGVFDAADWEPAVNYDETATVIRDGLITTGSLIVKQGGSYTAGITGNTSGDSAIRFWAGSDFNTRTGAPFRVTQGGKLTATGVDVTGKITATEGSFTGTVTATSGSFTGSINATSGTIGGWSIKSTYIDSTSGGGSFYLASNADTSNYYIQATGTDGVTRFSLGKNGVVTATGVNITGAVTATSGSFTGAIYARSGTFKGTISASTIRGSTITGSNISGGTININNRFKVKSSGELELTSSSGYIAIGGATSHPWLSAVNVYSGNGVRFMTGSTVGAAGSERGYISINTSDAMTLSSNGTINVRPGTSVSIRASGGYAVFGSYSSNLQTPSSGATYIWSRGHVTIRSGGSSYNVYVARGTGGAERIATSSSGISSLNLKKNIKELKAQEYTSALDILKNIKLYEYDYKYNINRPIHDFGFIIEDIENIKGHNKFFSFIDEKAKVTKNNELDHAYPEEHPEDKDILEYKRYDVESLVKYLLVVNKAFQNKIEELEERINER